ncbi:MAG: ECF transporter S component [Ruminococcaceae bacterium]|nr:ECF transporter S component [Oscillospiraceae bacterium]
MGNKKTISTKTMVLGAVLTALVIVLQFMGAFIHLGMFSISLVLIPIVIGAATCGISIGAWLGLVFGLVVLFSGDASAFLMINAPGTVITVLAKGVLAGFCAGLIYKWLEKYNRTVAVIAAAIVCPLVNTGVFLIGCFVFFFEAIKAWGVAGGYENVIQYMLLGLVGGNFLFELGTNIVLAPIVVRLINIRKKQI